MEQLLKAGPVQVGGCTAMTNIPSGPCLLGRFSQEQRQTLKKKDKEGRKGGQRTVNTVGDDTEEKRNRRDPP